MIHKRIDSGRRRRGLDGEIGFGLGATEVTSGGVVSACGVHGGVEGAEPDARFLIGIANLCCVAAPWSLPHASEARLLDGCVVVGGDGGRDSTSPHNVMEREDER